MKTKIIDEVKQAQEPYPHLREFEDGTVVLFSSLGAGMVVHAGNDPENPAQLGEWSTEWAEQRTKLFLGKLVLSNF